MFFRNVDTRDLIMNKFSFLLLLTSFLFLAGCQQPQSHGSPSTKASTGASPSLAASGKTDQPDTETPAEEDTTAATPTPEKGNADVVHVRAVKGEGKNTWTFHVTVKHPDQGWEDYADGWDVVTPEGKVLKTDPEDPFTRLLLHPHVDEQPFTRSQRGIVIPPDVSKVRVRAHDLVDGFGGEEVVVDLNQSSGDGYDVER